MALVGLGCPPWDRKAGKDKVIIARLLDSVGHKGGVHLLTLNDCLTN